jgi:hypothetical protein
MTIKKLAAAAALLALVTPSLAFDTRESGASTIFYISIPLDTPRGYKGERWSAGLQLQGKREYQAVRIDSSMLNFMSLNDIPAKWMIAGLVAAGAAVAIGGKDKSTTSSLQQQQTQNEQSGGCTKPVLDPCAK